MSVSTGKLDGTSAWDIHFDVPAIGQEDQGMWIVAPVAGEGPRGEGRWDIEEEAQAECDKRNKALGWGPEWTGEIE